MEPAVHDPEDASQWSEGTGDEPLAELSAIVDLLRRRCAVDFSGYKTTTLSRRVRHRMIQGEAADGAAYLQRLGDDEAERHALCSDLLIHVTEFFRDPAVFARLADEVLPDLLRGRDPSDDLRIWSAGCASGEEAYTLAMLALDVAGRMGYPGNVKVFATDIAGDVLEQASLLRRYFVRDPLGGVRVDTTLRRHVVFARHNLLNDPPFTRIDLVVCRNLLIYLQPQAQIKALSQLHFALKPHGVLLLGASETVGALQAQAFAPMDCSHKLFRKQPVALARLIDVPSLGAQSVPLQPEMALPGVAGQPPEVLEAELLATRERLQEMVLELQASHERLDLGNEELTASNEELQSTNEELKSVNEDLYALNHELESKNAELAELNRDYDQLLDSTEIGIVFLDAALQLRRFSPAVSEFLALRSSDMGRPVREISYRLGQQDAFMAELQRCAGDKARIEREIRLPDGRWVYQRMLPFKDDSSLDGGVVLTWTDISEIKRMQSLAEQLAADRTRLLGILDVLPDGVYIVSQAFDIEYLNPALEREFGPIQGRKCYEYFHGRSSRCDWCKNQEV
ncbi:MAG: PAS domain-containing protein, partial [Burkholderiaceae bacterium]|nr:PAS domain-containing protein [Burkholderiaceae bacterium]